ncbi:50S ribosomal protein L18 [Alphaproteobacteria bacterium]|nr:50S ribosomal protein L18 [Alphaproteobacteria bacterium]
MNKTDKLFLRRKRRNRYALRAQSIGKHRLSVYLSNKNIYVQVIDDAAGSTVASVSSLEKAWKLDKAWNKAAAEKAGAEIAKRAVAAGVKQVVFDRGGYLYHGRVAALADAARAGGLVF